MKTEEEVNINIITNVLTREGGAAFTNLAGDQPTKYGITQDTLSSYRGRRVSFEDLKALQEDEARKIYLEIYIERPGFNKIVNHQLRELLADCGVNSGPRVAVQWLQRALGVKEDGIFGPNTLSALGRANLSDIYKKICSFRIKFYVHLALLSREKTQFLMGWINRATAFLETDFKGTNTDVV